MKKRWIVLLAVLAVLAAFLRHTVTIKAALFFECPALASLPVYDYKKGYMSDGFQDYTIYREYHYSDSKKMQRCLERSSFFEKVKKEDIERINGYLDDFDGWLVYTDFEEECKFDYACIDTSDYWYLINKWQDEDELYFDYDLYYYDTQTMTMYMIHNNI